MLFNACAREGKRRNVYYDDQRYLSTSEKQHLHRELWGLSLRIRSAAPPVPPELEDRASKQLNTSQGADDSPLNTLLSLVATSLLHSLQRFPLATIGSRYSCSAVQNNRYCIVSAYASHTSFLRVLQSDCNLIAPESQILHKNRIAVIPDPFPHAVLHNREKGAGSPD